MCADAQLAMTKDTTSRRHFTQLNLLAHPLRLGSFRGEIIDWSVIEPVWWRNHLHSHSFFEVRYVFQGQGTFCLHGAQHEVSAGQLFVARPGETHEIISSHDDPLGAYHWSFTLAPHGWRSDRLGIDGLFSTFVAAHQAVGRRAEAVQPILDLLTAEIATREPGYTHVIAGLVTTLMIDTARALTDVSVLPEVVDPPARSLSEALVQHMIAYLRDNYARTISVRDVAAQAHLSERHANRLFHQEFGVSISEYLTQLRLDIAAQLLTEGHLSVKEVAHASGYPNVHYFTTLFHHRMGVTPSAFQRGDGTRLLLQS
jgi:AraC family L-rhamnose operon transcriptional activator RhaR